MEFVTGKKESRTLELSELLTGEMTGREVRVNGAVHVIRDMGNIAFIILRKREGLVQCVYEEGVSGFELKDVKEADTVEVTGVLTESEKGAERDRDPAERPGSTEQSCGADAPGDRQVEAQYIAGSEAELQADLTEKHQGESKVQDPGRDCERIPGFLIRRGIHRDPYSEDRRQERGGRGEHVPSGLFPQAGSPAAEPAVL